MGQAVESLGEVHKNCPNHMFAIQRNFPVVYEFGK